MLRHVALIALLSLSVPRVVVAESSPARCGNTLVRKGNLLGDAEFAQACKRCFGEDVKFDFLPEGGGDGETVCREQEARVLWSSPGSTRLRPQCGEGVGDLRDKPGGLEKCKDCEGFAAHLEVYFLPWAGINRTLCKGSRRLQAQLRGGSDSAELAGAAAGDAAGCHDIWAPLGGDLRGDPRARAACERCGGAGARLQYFPAAGGRGATYCRAPDGRSARSTPAHVDQGREAFVAV